MQQNQATESEGCLNCENPLSPEDGFCAACGQKRTTGRITFQQLVADFLENVFNFDSRVFLTLRKLFIPGLLTAEYFRGRHKKYLHPFRLFLVVLILLVAMISWRLNEGIVSDGDILGRIDQVRIERRMVLEVDSLNALYKTKEGVQGLNLAIDSLKKEVYQRNDLSSDSIDLDNYFTLYGDDLSPMMHIDDVFSMEVEDLIDKYNIEGLKKQWMFRQNMKVIRDSRSFLRFMIGRVSWMCLILIPLLGLGLIPLYWRQNFYYVEHFIFSVHTHTFFFVLASLQLLGLAFLPFWTTVIFALLFAVYLVLAMKRFYGQPWWKTLLKFIFLSLVLYWVFVVLSFVIAIVLSVLLF